MFKDRITLVTVTIRRIQCIGWCTFYPTDSDLSTEQPGAGLKHLAQREAQDVAREARAHSCLALITRTANTVIHTCCRINPHHTTGSGQVDVLMVDPREIKTAYYKPALLANSKTKILTMGRITRIDTLALKLPISDFKGFCFAIIGKGKKRLKTSRVGFTMDKSQFY